jgi:hypothetical protein
MTTHARLRPLFFPPLALSASLALSAAHAYTNTHTTTHAGGCSELLLRHRWRAADSPTGHLPPRYHARVDHHARPRLQHPRSWVLARSCSLLLPLGKLAAPSCGFFWPTGACRGADVSSASVVCRGTVGCQQLATILRGHSHIFTHDAHKTRQETTRQHNTTQANRTQHDPVAHTGARDAGGARRPAEGDRGVLRGHWGTYGDFFHAVSVDQYARRRQCVVTREKAS